MSHKRKKLAAFVVANLLVFAVAAVAALLDGRDADLYYRSVQEDETLEWASFWAFLLAAGAWLLAVLRRRRAGAGVPWFFLGLAGFCFFVAMEEISWGQRLAGYRPPAYFLEHNYQQELNVHNVVSSDLRKLALKAVILGYGVVLPLVMLAGGARRVLSRLGVVAPPPALAPAFAATYLFYEIYPFKFAGEWSELMLGLGFLFAAMAGAREQRDPEAKLSLQPAAVAAALLAVLVLGSANTALSRRQRSVHPEVLAAAQSELEALRRDFQSGHLEVRCGMHKRLYTYMEQYEQDYLAEGAFAGLTAQGLPEERAGFLLDPWNSPYWLRTRCSKSKQRRVAFVYSFGPDRRRASSKWEILGDDIGAVIFDEGPGG